MFLRLKYILFLRHIRFFHVINRKNVVGAYKVKIITFGLNVPRQALTKIRHFLILFSEDFREILGSKAHIPQKAI